MTEIQGNRFWFELARFRVIGSTLFWWWTIWCLSANYSPHILISTTREFNIFQVSIILNIPHRQFLIIKKCQKKKHTHKNTKTSKNSHTFI